MTESIEDLILQKISSLQNSTVHERADILEELHQIIHKHGIKQQPLNRLLKLVFDVTNGCLQSQEKKFIIRNLLIPDGTYKLNTTLIYQILSSIGYSRVYFQNGQKVKQKKLTLTVQNLLLEWLICSLHIFDDDLFDKLAQLLPVILHLLLFEYLRPLLTNLTFVILLNANKFSHHNFALKNWQIKFLMDLYLKFPTDDYLKTLIILCHNLIPGLDYSKFLDDKNSNFNIRNISIKSHSIKYPNFEYLHKLISINPCHKNSPILQSCLNQYKTFYRNIFNNQLAKRPKYNGEYAITDIDILNSLSNNVNVYFNGDINNGPISIYDIKSLSGLVENFSRVEFLNLNSIFKEFYSYHNNIIRNNFIVFSDLIKSSSSSSSSSLDENRLLSQLNEFLEFNFINATKTELNFIIDKLVDMLYLNPNLPLPTVQKFITNSLPTKLDIMDLIPMQLKLLKFASSSYDLKYMIDQFLNKSNLISYKELNAHHLHTFFIECGNLFHTLYMVKGREVVPFINNSIKLIYDLFTSEFQNFSLLAKLGFLLMLKVTLKNINPNDLDIFDTQCILPPLAIIHNFLLTINPLIFSEFCGYLAFAKSKTPDKEHMSVQNAIIIDTLNFIWRDKAFHYENNTFNKGLFLAPTFIDKLPTLNVFGYSNLTQLNTVGNLFHNPAWCYLVTHIIWDLEDQDPNITTRHPGPITEESVDSIVNDPNHVWLNTNYDHLKLQVLRKLDAMGYVGLADLLFSSLRSLTHSRLSNP